MSSGVGAAGSHRWWEEKEASKTTCLSELHGLKPCGNEPCTCKDTPHEVRDENDDS